MVEYIYNPSSQELEPTFYDTDADRFIVYAQLEMSGQDRVKYIDEALYFYNLTMSVSGGCYHEHEWFDEYKSKIKYSLQRLEGLADQPRFEDRASYRVNANVTASMRKYYAKYVKCNEEAAKKGKTS